MTIVIKRYRSCKNIKYKSWKDARSKEWMQSICTKNGL